MTIREFRKIYGKSAIRTAWMHNLKMLSTLKMSSGKQPNKSDNPTIEKFRFVLEQSPDPVFILDMDLNFEYINLSFTQLSGYTEKDVLHRSLIDFVYEGEIFESHTHLIETLRKGEKWQGELLTIPKTGNSFWVSAIVIPYKNEKGIVKGYIIIQQDISARKTMEISLMESENLFRTLIVKSINGVALTQHSKIIMMNQAFCDMFGYMEEEIKNLDFTELLAADNRDRGVGTSYKRMVREMDSQGYSSLFVHKSGKGLTIEMNSTTVQVNGQHASFLTLIDRTEQYALKEELEESLHKYRELTEMLPQTVYEIDLKGIHTYLNQAAIKTFRYQASPIGRSAFDFILAEDHVRMKENMQKSITGNNFTTGNEYTGVRDDGTQFPVLVYGAPIFNKNKLVGTRGIIIDITERKAMENALRESETKYKTFIENSQDGIFAIIGDRIHFANNTLCKMLGYTSDEMYDMPAINLVVPEEHQRAGEIIRRRNSGDRSVVNEIFHFVAKDGSIRECDTFSSMLELNGKIASYLTVHDLTETRRIQEQLQHSEEKYRTLIDNANDGMVITQQGKVVFSSKAMCEMMLCAEEDVVGKSFLTMVAKEDWQTMLDFHKRRMDGEIFTSLYRSNFVRSDGKIITMELNARTSNYKGKPAAFIIMRNISDRVKIENELQIAKQNLEMLNLDLEQRVKESSERLIEARTQVINLQKENLQSQFEVLKQQVNPHFLFNSLNVLTSLIKLDPDLAEKFSEHLSKVYRYVLENKDNELVDLNTELVFLDAYIFLLKIRFVNKLNVSIDIPEPKRSYQIIPLAMQLLIENAIKHNTMSKSNPLQIDIFIDQQNFLNIVNNLQKRPSQIISTGVGLKNIQNRYMLLNTTIPVFEKTETHFIAKVPLVKND